MSAGVIKMVMAMRHGCAAAHPARGRADLACGLVGGRGGAADGGRRVGSGAGAPASCGASPRSACRGTNAHVDPGGRRPRMRCRVRWWCLVRGRCRVRRWCRGWCRRGVRRVCGRRRGGWRACGGGCGSGGCGLGPCWRRGRCWSTVRWCGRDRGGAGLPGLEAAGRRVAAAHAVVGRVRRVRRPGSVFVFPGQGAQWVGMGRESVGLVSGVRRAVGGV